MVLQGKCAPKAREKNSTFQVYFRGFYEKIRAEGANFFWGPKGWKWQKCCFFWQTLFSSHFFQTSQLFSSFCYFHPHFLRSIIFNLKGLAHCLCMEMRITYFYLYFCKIKPYLGAENITKHVGISLEMVRPSKVIKISPKTIDFGRISGWFWLKIHEICMIWWLMPSGDPKYEIHVRFSKIQIRFPK